MIGYALEKCLKCYFFVGGFSRGGGYVPRGRGRGRGRGGRGRGRGANMGMNGESSA